MPGWLTGRAPNGRTVCVLRSRLDECVTGGESVLDRVISLDEPDGRYSTGLLIPRHLLATLTPEELIEMTAVLVLEQWSRTEHVERHALAKALR